MAVLTNWYPPHIGGSAIVVHNVCREHAKRHEVTVLTPKRYEGPDRELLDGVLVKRFSNAHNRPEAYPDRRMITLCPGMLGEILLGGYDLLSAYPAITPNLRLCELAALLAGVPVVLTVFDLLDYRQFRLARFPDPGLLEGFYGRKGRLKQAVFRTEIARLKAVCGISATEVEFLKRFNARCFLVPVHVDLKEFEGIEEGRFRRALGVDGRPIVLCVGRIEPHKGQDVLLRVVPDVVRELPDALFVIAGPVDDPTYFASLRELVAELGIAGAVHFTGALARRTLIDAYVDCDIHVVPARFMNAGSVVQEAWAARKPVIQSNRVDPNHVEDGVDGYTFDLTEPGDLTWKILLLLSDPALRRRLGQRGRRKVEERFDYETGIARLEELYLAAIGR